MKLTLGISLVNYYDICFLLYLACTCIYTYHLFISARCDIVIDNRPRLDAVHKVKDRHTSGDSRILRRKNNT